MQETSTLGVGVISTANTGTDGSGNITTVFTAPASANGTYVKSVTIKALQSTNEGIVRIFILSAATGGTYYLVREVYIPQTVQSGFDPSFKQIIAMDFNLKSGMIIAATTQVAQSFAITVEGASWTYPVS